MLKINKLLSIFILFVLTKFAYAELSMTGYQEFFAGTADQSIYNGAANHGIDKAGLDNGTYTRITGNYSTTLDSGIEVTGTINMVNRDCQGDKTDNCNITNNNFVTFTSGFGSVSLGERFDAGAAMLSRLTASGPTAEPDGANYTSFYTADAANKYGNANETHYAENSMKILYASNVYNGFSFATSYTPNTSRTGLNSTNNGQATALGDFSEWSSFNDVTQLFGKYAMDIDGIGVEAVYGVTSGNAGQFNGNNYNDLDETAYSLKINYGGFEADYRKNDSGNSGYIKNGNAGNNEGTSICGGYTFGSIRAMACSVETSFIDANNRTNSSETITYAADYSLGGGVTLGLLYFDVEQTANDQTRTDVDGLMTMLAFGF